jgi:hypothetical protein
VDVEGRRIIKRTNLFEDLLVHISYISVPVGWRMVEDVMQFDPGYKSIELLFQKDVFFCFVGKKKDEFDGFIGHLCDFSDDLITRSDAATSSHKKDPFIVLLHSIFIKKILPKMTFPPYSYPNFP